MRRLVSVVALAAVYMLGVNAQAGVPPTPREFSAKGMYTDSIGIFKAVLSWWAGQWENDASRPTGFYIYRASGRTEDLSQFSRIATVEFDTSKRSQQVYSYTDYPLQAGTYSYYITAYNDDGESQRSPIRQVVVPPNTPPDDLLRFITEPSKRGSVGVEYRYQAQASTPLQNVTIRYQLVNGPDGMTIDQSTGLVTWTPQRPGRYEVSIKAIIEWQGQVISAVQHWVIEVEGEGHDENCVEIEGIVLDGNSNTMTNGVVVAYHAVTRNNQTSWIVAKRAELSDAGTFTMRLSTGSYKFLTEGRDYLPQWYENSSTADQARVLTFECTDSTTSAARLVFVVQPRQPEQRYTVSGRVTSADNGQGVAAWVKFIAVINERDDHGNDWARHQTFTAETDAEGYYSIQLSNRHSYIARAIPRSDDYLPLYWDGASSITQATQITLTDNRDGINFVLPLRLQAHGGFSGRIIDSAGNGLQGWAIACRVVERNNDRGERIRRYRTVETNAEGYYHFTNLEPGVYVVLGIAQSRDWVPGFCVLGNWTTLRWRSATRIQVGNALLDVQYDIKLRPRTGDRGIIRLEGTVRGHGGQIKIGSAEQGVTPVAGALVAVVTSEGVTGYAISQGDGYFAIPDLVPISGELIVDHPDYETYTTSLVLDPTATAVGYDPTMEPAQVSTVIDEELGTITLAPNPAASEVVLQLGRLSGTVRVELVSMLGTRVATVAMDAPLCRLTLGDVAPGVYAVRIVTDTQVRTVPLVIVR